MNILAVIHFIVSFFRPTFMTWLLSLYVYVLLLFLSAFSVSFVGIFSPHFDHYLIFLAPSANIRYRNSASHYDVCFVHAIKSLFACTRAQNSSWRCFIATGSRHSTSIGTNRFGFWRSNAVDLEICCGRCCRCCSSSHTINRSLDTNASSGASFRALPWRCLDGEGYRALVLLQITLLAQFPRD